MHQPILTQRMHLDGLSPTRLQLGQGLGHGHLVHQDLGRRQGLLGDPVPGLNQRRVPGFLGGRHAGGTGKEAPDVDRIGGVISALVDHLEHIASPDDAGRDLHATGAPAIGEGHLTRAERHLVARYGHRLEQGPANALLGALIQKSKVVMGLGHDGSWFMAVASPAATWLARSLRTRASSA